MIAEASAAAKAILFGEHAVVYGQPAIAVPISDLRATARFVSRQDTDGLRIVAHDLNRVMPVEPDTVTDALSLIIQLLRKALNIPLPHADIEVTSAIPLASGLGSGAAVGTAVARVFVAGMNRSIADDALNAIIFESEKLFHGTPSGIDNTVIVYERPVYFVREHPIEPLAVGRDFIFVLADTGISAPTHASVGDVRALVENQPDEYKPLISAIGDIAARARSAIAAGDIAETGRLMRENHRLLQRLTVSSAELDTLVDAAISAGATGAKLSGGGRGGNMLALVTPEISNRVQEALLSAGAVATYATMVRST